MLKEFLELLQNTAVKAHGVNLRPVPGDNRRLFVDRPGSEAVEFVDMPPALRSHAILGIDDFIEAVKRWGQSGVVFHSPSKIVLVVDDADRRDVVSMALVESETFQFMRTVGKAAMSHRDMVNVLKHNLRDHVIDSLLPSVRKLDVDSSTKQSAEIARGRERGTREFVADLVGANNIPETVNVTTSVYSNAGLRQSCTIKCSFDVAIPGLEFTLKPLPDELNIAVENAQTEIHQILAAALDGIPVLFGSP